MARKQRQRRKRGGKETQVRKGCRDAKRRYDTGKSGSRNDESKQSRKRGELRGAAPGW